MMNKGRGKAHGEDRQDLVGKKSIKRKENEQRKNTDDLIIPTVSRFLWYKRHSYFLWIISVTSRSKYYLQ